VPAAWGMHDAEILGPTSFDYFLLSSLTTR
jgi:hypothetical protein